MPILYPGGPASAIELDIVSRPLCSNGARQARLLWDLTKDRGPPLFLEISHKAGGDTEIAIREAR